MFFYKKAPHQPCCLAFHITAAVLMFLVTVAAFVGVITAHISPMDGAVVFGSPAGSLAIVAFGLSLIFLVKTCKGCMSSCEACMMPGKKK